MKIDKYILNEILNSKSYYYLINKKTPERRHIHTIPQTDQAIVVSFNVPRKFWDFTDVNEMKLSQVEEFSDTVINSNIYLGNEYSPFQHGLSFSDVSSVILVDEVKIMDFIIRCYNENVSDFYKAQDILNEMKLSITPKSK